MSTEKYAVFFPEGDGYLFCSNLGSGAFGVASVVRSIADNEDYVRKKTKPTSAASAASSGVYSPEVSFYREHPLIPRLVRHQDFSVLPEDHKDHGEFKSSSMIFSLCNAGTLRRFADLMRQKWQPIPELLIWHFLDQGLRVLDFLNQGYPYLVHADVHFANLFLHFSNDAQKLPDLYLGDFGQAYLLDPQIWEISQNPARNGLNPNTNSSFSEAIFWDIRHFVKAIMLFVLVTNFGLKADYSNVEKATAFMPFSSDFMDVMRELMAASLVHDGNEATGNHSERYEDIVRIRRRIATKAIQARSPTANLPNYGWIKPELYQEPGAQAAPGPYKPAFYASRRELLRDNRDLSGPWRIARIDALSDKILGVEKLAFGLHLPHISQQCRGGCDCWRRPDAARNWDDHAKIPALIKTEVDTIGMNKLIQEAGAISGGGPVSGHFDLDAEWTLEKLSPGEGESEAV